MCIVDRLKHRMLWVGMLVLACIVCLPGMALADVGATAPDEASGSPASISNVEFTAVPFRYILIHDDTDKFETHHWMKEGYNGGIDNVAIHGSLLDGVTLEADGRALIDQNDYAASFTLRKEGLWYLMFHFEEFRKYFDGTGGTYYPWNRFLNTNGGISTQLDNKKLELDIGKIAIELGITPENWPAFVLFYEHHYKNGAKSRLTWGEAEAVSGTTRNITPSWQDIDETVDTFSIEASDQVAGYDIRTKQTFEYFGAETMRQENDLALTGSAGDYKAVKQTQNPRSFLFATLVELERWFFEERAHVSTAYRYTHLNAEEFETLLSYNGLTGAGISNTFPAEFAENNYDAHTWVASLFGTPHENVTVKVGLKGEQFRRTGDAIHYVDTTSPPNGVDDTYRSNTKNKGGRLGQNVAVQFNGIPHTAVYGELDLQESRAHLTEGRTAISDSDDVIDRDTLTDIFKSVLTFGTRVAPIPQVDITTQVRRKFTKNHFDDRRELIVGASDAGSAFIDQQDITVNEFTTRLTVKPIRQARGSFRYQLQDVDYDTRAEGLPNVPTSMLSNIFTFDIAAEPVDNLFLTGSVSKQYHTTKTPADQFGTNTVPKFNADVLTWLFAGSYAPNENVSFDTTVLFSSSSNFRDFTAIGLPLGVDNERVEVTGSMDLKINDNVTLKPEYAFYRFLPNNDAETGAYYAHLLALEANIAWG